MCDDPLHDDRNEGLWHVWRDDEGRLFAQRCPESVVREKADRERRSEHPALEDHPWKGRDR